MAKSEQEAIPDLPPPTIQGDNQSEDADASAPDNRTAIGEDDEISEADDVSEESAETPQGFRKARVREIPSGPGVYALCDLDGVPLYVGQSVDGIQARVRRHLTSARSDIIANRMVDIWEVASVQCWEVCDARTTFAKQRDVQIGTAEWNAATAEALNEMKARHATELVVFKASLPTDLSRAEKIDRIAEFNADQKEKINTLKRSRAEELRKKKTEFESNHKETWEATRKDETQKLKTITDTLEAYLYTEFNSKKLLMNAKSLDGVPEKPSTIPEVKTVVVMQRETCEMRRIDSLRLPRQANHYSSLLDHILNVKNNHILKVALNAHHQRLSDYHKKFIRDAAVNE